MTKTESRDVYLCWVAVQHIQQLSLQGYDVRSSFSVRQTHVLCFNPWWTACSGRRRDTILRALCEDIVEHTMLSRITHHAKQCSAACSETMILDGNEKQFRGAASESCTTLPNIFMVQGRTSTCRQPGCYATKEVAKPSGGSISEGTRQK